MVPNGLPRWTNEEVEGLPAGQLSHPDHREDFRALYKKREALVSYHPPNFPPTLPREPVVSPMGCVTFRGLIPLGLEGMKWETGNPTPTFPSATAALLAPS